MLRSRRFSLLLCIAIGLLASPLFGQSTFDGQSWKEWSTDRKIFYVVGYVDGRASGVWDAIEALDPKLFAKGSAALQDPRLASLERSLSVGQIIESMDQFYGDYKNLNIGIRTAVSVVSDQLAGVDVTEAKLQAIRRIEASRKENE